MSVSVFAVFPLYYFLASTELSLAELEGEEGGDFGSRYILRVSLLSSSYGGALARSCLAS